MFDVLTVSPHSPVTFTNFVITYSMPFWNVAQSAASYADWDSVTFIYLTQSKLTCAGPTSVHTFVQLAILTLKEMLSGVGT